mmetsp:Transcript_6866/g.871  ORF Transcript_6866/g.871 Transcript_6866/m.871 type:complete len:110 (+) Transcript_6866:342-671(+)
MVMELCTGGELFDKVIKKVHFTEKEAAEILYKLLHATNHLHSVNICHRDLKPENCLFDSEKDDAEIKVIDFGLSNKFGAGEDSMHTLVGTPYYVAPEVLRKNYGLECDI